MGAAQGENILYNLLFYSVFLTVEIKILKKRPPKREQAKAVYSELAGTRESATITCLW